VTKRAIAHEGATMEWIDGNIGSKVTMKYPSVILGRRATLAVKPFRLLLRARVSTRMPARR
jgi:Fe-S cluster assembly scaffold protein SufB